MIITCEGLSLLAVLISVHGINGTVYFLIQDQIYLQTCLSCNIQSIHTFRTSHPLSHINEKRWNLPVSIEPWVKEERSVISAVVCDDASRSDNIKNSESSSMFCNVIFLCLNTDTCWHMFTAINFPYYAM
jgi:hypothetical protein